MADTTVRKGKPAGKKTVAIRKLLDKYDGNITYERARAMLEKLGFSEDASDTAMKINANKWSVVKHWWLTQHDRVGTRGKARSQGNQATHARRGRPRQPTKVTAGDLAEAMAVVQKVGKLSEYRRLLDEKKSELEEQQQEIAAMQAVVDQIDSFGVDAFKKMAS